MTSVSFDAFVDEAVKQARPKVASAQLTVPAGFAITGAAPGSQADFCKLWPTIKAGLDILKTILPGWAGWAVGIVIEIGNKLCGL